MADQRLVTFIKNSLEKGLGRTEIEQALVQKGWSGVQVSEAFAQAQATAASGTAKAVAAASSGKTLYVILGVLLILFVAVGAAIVFWPSGDTGCSSSRDCSSGYDCVAGECVVSAEEDTTSTRTTTTTTTTTEEEPECYFDSDCDDGYECSEDYTCEIATTTSTSTSTSNATSADPNYLIDYVKLSYVSMSTISFSVNVSNDEDTSTNDDIYLSCYVVDNVTYNSANNLTSLGLNKESGPDGLDSNVRTCGAEINGTLLYSTLLDKSPIKFTVNTTIDYYDDVTETDEEDNSLITYFEVFEENITFSLPSIVCSTDSGCSSILNSSYVCTSGYCAGVVETATLSEDCSALTCESPYVCSSSNVCVECVADTDCTSGACDTITNTCVECDENADCTSGACDIATNICVSATSTIACDDSVDNDGDGLIDYRSGCDTDANGLIDYVCGTYDTAQNHNEGYTSYGEVDSTGACNENWYNLVDNNYFDRTVLCGIDEDLDGSVINKDDGCLSALDISESLSVECSVDGDCGDGYKCVSSVCEIAETCDDSVDNDGDTYVDCLDSDCDGSDGCEYGTEVTCDDSVDNDGDSKTDTEDSDCYECVSNSECGGDVCVDNYCVPLYEEVSCVSDSDGDEYYSSGYVVDSNGYYWGDVCLSTESELSSIDLNYDSATGYDYLFEGICSSSKYYRKVYDGIACFGVVSYSYCYKNDDITGDYATTNTFSAYTSSTLSDDPLVNDEDMVDSCANLYGYRDENYLLEFYSSSSIVYQKIYSCAYGCEDGVCCEDSICSNNLNAACNDLEDNDDDGLIDYSGACNVIVSVGDYGILTSKFELFSCAELFLESGVDLEVTESNYLTQCKALCKQKTTDALIEAGWTTEDDLDGFYEENVYYARDKGCFEVYDDSEEGTVSTIPTGKKLGAAELEQNIFRRILNFVIESNPVIDLFRKN
ncbi:hypothetical protein J4467_02700 [Candidatus Woesearchaeota archaeon]|nr:hypothetical protein [Candidatus Woesearchaeota archaeon]